MEYITQPFSPQPRCITSFEAAFAGLAVMCHKVNPKASTWMFFFSQGCSKWHIGQLGGGFKYFFTPTWGNDPIWLIFFKGVETTSQTMMVQVTHLDGPMEKNTDIRSDGKKLLKKIRFEEKLVLVKVGCKKCFMPCWCFFSELSFRMELFAPIPRKSPNIFGQDFLLEDDWFFHLLDGLFGPVFGSFKRASNSPIPIPNKPNESPVHHCSRYHSSPENSRMSCEHQGLGLMKLLVGIVSF